MSNNTPIVPDIWYKSQRVARTVVQSLVTLIPIVNTIAIVVVAYLNEQTDVSVPAWIFLALNGIVVATAFLMGLVARIMAIPGVNKWLVKFNLASIPKHLA